MKYLYIIGISLFLGYLSYDIGINPDSYKKDKKIEKSKVVEPKQAKMLEQEKSKIVKPKQAKMLEQDRKALGALGQINSDWKYLSDGESFNGWHIFKKDSVNDSWTIEDGAFVYVGATDGNSTGSDLISNDSYTNFVLSLDWKVAEGANSGIFYGVNEESDFDQPYFTAPEIQVIDNNNYDWSSEIDGETATHTAGALYDLVGPSENNAKSFGEWNNYIIEINHNINRGSVSLNETNIVNFPLSGEEWDEMISNSKFKDWSEFGKHKTGKIGLQDHGGRVSYRNIKIKEL